MEIKMRFALAESKLKLRYVHTKGKHLRVMMPLITAQNDIGIDNTCKSLDELQAFFGKSESDKGQGLGELEAYRAALSFDLAVLNSLLESSPEDQHLLNLRTQKEGRLQDLNKAVEALEALKKSTSMAFLYAYRSGRGGTRRGYDEFLGGLLRQGFSNVFSIHLLPKTPDPVIYSSNPVFSLTRDRDGDGDRDRGGALVSRLFNALQTLKEKPASLKEIISSNAIQSALEACCVNEGETPEAIGNSLMTPDKFSKAQAALREGVKPYVGESDFFTEHFSNIKLERGETYRTAIDRTMLFKGEGTVSDFIEALLNDSAPRDLYASVSPFHAIETAEPAEVTEALSILVQFFLGCVNVHAVANGIVSRHVNFARILDKSRNLSDQLVEKIKMAISEKKSIEDAILDFIIDEPRNKFVLSRTRPFNNEDRAAIKEKFKATYSTVKQIAHFDEFLFFEKVKGCFINHYVPGKAWFGMAVDLLWFSEKRDALFSEDALSEISNLYDELGAEDFCLTSKAQGDEFVKFNEGAAPLIEKQFLEVCLARTCDSKACSPPFFFWMIKRFASLYGLPSLEKTRGFCSLEDFQAFMTQASPEVRALVIRLLSEMQPLDPFMSSIENLQATLQLLSDEEAISLLARKNSRKAVMKLEWTPNVLFKLEVSKEQFRALIGLLRSKASIKMGEEDFWKFAQCLGAERFAAVLPWVTDKQYQFLSYGKRISDELDLELVALFRSELKALILTPDAFAELMRKVGVEQAANQILPKISEGEVLKMLGCDLPEFFHESVYFKKYLSKLSADQITHLLKNEGLRSALLNDLKQGKGFYSYSGLARHSREAIFTALKGDIQRALFEGISDEVLSSSSAIIAVQKKLKRICWGFTTEEVRALLHFSRAGKPAGIPFFVALFTDLYPELPLPGTAPIIPLSPNDDFLQAVANNAPRDNARYAFFIVSAICTATLSVTGVELYKALESGRLMDSQRRTAAVFGGSFLTGAAASYSVFGSGLGVGGGAALGLLSCALTGPVGWALGFLAVSVALCVGVFASKHAYDACSSQYELKSKAPLNLNEFHGSSLIKAKVSMSLFADKKDRLGYTLPGTVSHERKNELKEKLLGLKNIVEPGSAG